MQLVATRILMPLLVGLSGAVLLHHMRREYGKVLGGPYNNLTFTQQPGSN